jgi:hypothetical protein
MQEDADGALRVGPLGVSLDSVVPNLLGVPGPGAFYIRQEPCDRNDRHGGRADFCRRARMGRERVLY